MPQIFPLNSYGNRMFSVSIETGDRRKYSQYWIRTYYSEGQINAWFLDMWDSQMVDLVKGLPIVVGSANLLSSYHEKFPKGSKLIAVQTDGTQDNPDVLGNGLELVWYSGSEKSPYVIPDPMMAASISDFEIPSDMVENDHNILNNRFIPDQHNIQSIQGLNEELSKKVADAPIDNNIYGRQNQQWVFIGQQYFGIEGDSLILLDS